MTFDYLGYDLIYIQKECCKDDTAHLFSEIYKFFSPITKYKYILRADFHEEDVFAVKFYVQQHSHSDFKYSKITNKKDVGNILITCLKVIPALLTEYPTASFAFMAAPSINAKRVESLVNNQRFKTYTYIASQKIGQQTFEHFTYENISSYLLLNRKVASIAKEEAIKKMFTQTYPRLLEII